MPIVRVLAALALAGLAGCANDGMTPSGDDATPEPPAAVGSDPAPAGADTAAVPPGTPGAPGAPTVQIPADARSVEFQSIPSATGPAFGIRDRRRQVIRNFPEWQAWYDGLYSHMTPTPPALRVDFAQQMVVAASMGQRSTGGHTISVDGVAVGADGTVYVTVIEGSPGVTCVTTQSLTAPAVAVVLEHLPGRVVFVDETLFMMC